MTVKNLITAGYITSFREMFPIIRKSVVARDLGMNNARFNALMKEPKKFTLEELYRLATFLEVEEKVVLDLTHKQYLIDKKKKLGIADKE